MQISSGDRFLSVIVFPNQDPKRKINKEQTICFSRQTRSICFCGFFHCLSALLHPRTRGEYLPGKDFVIFVIRSSKRRLCALRSRVGEFEITIVVIVLFFANIPKWVGDLRCVWKGSGLSESIAKRRVESNLLKVSILVAGDLSREQVSPFCVRKNSEIMLLILRVRCNHMFRWSEEKPWRLYPGCHPHDCRAQQRDQRTICLPSPFPSA